MQQRNECKWLAGAADICELLARAFTYPNGMIAKALSDGSFQADVRSCATDLGIEEKVEPSAKALDAFVGSDEVKLNESMRRGFSRMYLVGGSHVPIFPYEGAFRFAADNRQGEPSLFANRSAVNAQKCMQEAGVEIDISRGEPADALWFELAFLSYCYANNYVAAQKHDIDSTEAHLWADHLHTFTSAHSSWLIPFMEQTCNLAPDLDTSGVYASVAHLALVALPCLLKETTSQPVSSKARLDQVAS